MGAWGYEVLCNDRALDRMSSIEKSKNIKGSILKLFQDNDCIDEIVLGCELVDISINGVDEEILGSTYNYNDFFKSLTNELELKDKAIEMIKFAQENDDGWFPSVKKERADLLKRIEKRLIEK